MAPKWAWPVVRDPISKFWDPLNISQTGKATIFKFGTRIGRGQFLPPDHKLARNWASPAARDPISKFWDPLIISQTKKATIFKFGTRIGRGQFLFLLVTDKRTNKRTDGRTKGQVENIMRPASLDWSTGKYNTPICSLSLLPSSVLSL